MPHMKFRLDVAICCVALLLSGISLANASSLFATTTLVVPDEGNNRVLLIFLSRDQRPGCERSARPKQL